MIIPVNAPFDFESISRATPTTAAIVRLSDGATFDDLRAAGLEVISTAGDDMAVVVGDIEDIIAMNDNADVQSFSLSAPAKPMLNETRKLNGVTTIHNGEDHLDSIMEHLSELSAYCLEDDKAELLSTLDAAAKMMEHLRESITPSYRTLL